MLSKEDVIHIENKINSSHPSSTFTMDELLTYCSQSSLQPEQYLQLIRNGWDCLHLKPGSREWQRGTLKLEFKFIPNNNMEDSGSI